MIKGVHIVGRNTGERDERIAIGTTEGPGTAHDSHFIGTRSADQPGDHKCPVMLAGAIVIFYDHRLEATCHTREVARLDRVAAAIPELLRGHVDGFGDIEREEDARPKIGREGSVEGRQEVRVRVDASNLDVHIVIQDKRLVSRFLGLCLHGGGAHDGKEYKEHSKCHRYIVGCHYVYISPSLFLFLFLFC